MGLVYIEIYSMALNNKLVFEMDFRERQSVNLFRSSVNQPPQIESLLTNPNLNPHYAIELQNEFYS